MNIKEVIIGTIMVIVFGGIIYGLLHITILEDIKTLKLCANKLNIKYGYWSNEGDVVNLRHEYISNEYFNCCWDDVYLDEEGYYKDKRCKGFIK